MASYSDLFSICQLKADDKEKQIAIFCYLVVVGNCAWVQQARQVWVTFLSPRWGRIESRIKSLDPRFHLNPCSASMDFWLPLDMSYSSFFCFIFVVIFSF